MGSYAEWGDLYPESFNERMDEAKDIAAIKGPRRLSRGVTYRRTDLTEWRSVGQAATELGVSKARVKVLCAEGRIPGAHRKGRPWQIPARLQPDKAYRIEVTFRSKGPKTKFPVLEPAPF